MCPESDADVEILDHVISEKENTLCRKDEVTSVGTLDLSPQKLALRSVSPASSSSSASATFEPTIDMMVNDFDDEETLNEEEALSALESQDPQDEIATLKEESEMPLEMLLTKYRAFEADASKKFRKKARSRKRKSYKINTDCAEEAGDDACSSQTKICATEQSDQPDVILIESEDEDAISMDQKSNNSDDIDTCMNSSVNNTFKHADVQKVGYLVQPSLEKIKPRRSHLLDLYPKESFTSKVGDEEIPLELVSDEDDDEEEEEAYTDYERKTIMIGSVYQAMVPSGLSQYGDVLPYENEDKLIWEPSQVSEQEVEEYLLKVQDIKTNLSELNETALTALGDDAVNLYSKTENIVPDKKSINNVEKTITSNRPTSTASVKEREQRNVVKDNEQALHLLVQCGYDFKEAIRRKRLNAVPLTGSMSLWSEEECQKFEEGIQKFGKDFLKIRQHQVRTRTMRELVQFYYIWKKSERRDHDYANSDTVDHMDIYLNESGDYGPNANSSTSVFGTHAASSAAFTTRRNFSIMTGNKLKSEAIDSPFSGSSNRQACAVTPQS